MKGELTFDVEGERYVLFLGNAAQCAIEEQYDVGFFAVVTDAMPNVAPHVAVNPELYPEEVLAASRSLRMSVLRDLAWYGLRRYHPDLTLDGVSDLIDAMGQAAFGELIGKAIFATRDTGAGTDAKPGKLATRASGRTGTPAKRTGRKPVST